jgi:iron complex outermembrane receptor protein
MSRTAEVSACPAPSRAPADVIPCGCLANVVRATLVSIVFACCLARIARADDLAQQPAGTPPEPPLYETVVTATTPLHGSDLPRDRVPANVQVVTGQDLADHKSLDVTAYMNEATGSVSVNNVQNNPLQPDFQYRGFLSSPLLGAPQGLSLYLDGVRLNEPFGDTINWDLLPTTAIRSVNVIPGSNPVFGLNTLGGALSLQTKTGFSDPGASGTLMYGSWNRKVARVDGGAHGERFAIFGAAELFDEDGWRQFSPARAERAFLSGSYASGGSTADLSLIAADTNLTGNGPAPEQLLAVDRSAVFTVPDITLNQLFMATLRGERPVGEHVRLSGVAYVRTNRTRTVNGDQRDWAECMAMPGVLCSTNASGMETPIVDAAGNPVPFMTTYDAANNRTDTRQTSAGASAQVAVNAPVAQRENHLFAGADFAQSRIHFRSQTTVATLDDVTRATIDAGFVDPDAAIAVDSVVNAVGVYLYDNYSVRRDLFVTLSGRFNLSTLSLDDQIGGALSGDHTFNRFNPGVGLSYQPRPWLGVYASYAESSRAPTAIELTCASPADPCRLPNAFLSDPPLAQVVARTFEGGVRGSTTRAGLKLDYDVTAFGTFNSNDILFISSGMVANQGFFSNVGRTRRLGLEADLIGRQRLGRGSRLDWSLYYTFMDATFETAFLAPSALHPDAVNGAIDVPAGAHIPSIPRHIGKAGLTFTAVFGLAAGVNVIANSAQYLRGDEANLLPQVPGYVVVNARAAYRFWSHADVFILVNNIFDAKYSNFGVLGDATDVLGPAYASPRFVGPGAPRAGWIGVDVHD